MGYGRFMHHVAAAAVLLSLSLPSSAEIFTWIDDSGATHYGDEPPDDLPARRLDPAQTTVTTVGTSGLRDGERAFLQRADERRAAEAAAAAAKAAARPANVNVTVNPPPVVVRRPRSRAYALRPPYHHYPRASWGWQFDYQRRGLHFSLGGGSATGAGVTAPPSAPGATPAPPRPSPRIAPRGLLR